MQDEARRDRSRNLSPSPTDTVVGERYDVPCVRIVPDTVFPNEFLKTGELVPVFLPAHEDAEYFDFPHFHYHVDFRFVSTDLWERMLTCTAHVHACIITVSLVAEEPRIQPLVCMRAMPEFPRAQEIEQHDTAELYDGLVAAVCGLEGHYQAFRIDTGTLVCPHRGVCLKGLPVADRTVVCPAHGLAWNVDTGALVARHGAPERPAAVARRPAATRARTRRRRAARTR